MRLKGFQKAIAALALVPICAVSLTSCGRSSGQYAEKACSYVNRSIVIYKAAEKDVSKATIIKKDEEALLLLRKALPLAALAAGTNGAWQALQATLSESNRVPESRLIGALSQQCATNSQYANVNIPASTVPSN
jgi:hypothetical protein